MTKITPEDLRDYTNGTVTGNTYIFWGDQRIESGSLQRIITRSESYLKYVVGSSTWNSTDEDISGNITSLVLNYCMFRTAVLLAGGMVTQGFDYAIGPLDVKRSQSQQFFYTKLIDGFKQEALDILSGLQPFSISNETDMPSWGQTSTPVM